MPLKVETGTENKILRAKSRPAKTITRETLKFIKKMEETMMAEKGVGLAAPQVGKNERIIVALLNQKTIVPMINPEITAHSEEICLGEEGCLSLPGQWGNVRRFKEIIVKYKTPKNEERMMKLEDFNARIVQHEIDHLNGILFTDLLETEDVLLAQLNKKHEIEKI
ncbi:peptide deformylase [Candidatus Peregrinibacteria bacterium]|nr:peptide deformylase [Candidatus Peregrinibacteria bacterium]